MKGRARTCSYLQPQFRLVQSLTVFPEKSSRPLCVIRRLLQAEEKEREWRVLWAWHRWSRHNLGGTTALEKESVAGEREGGRACGGRGRRWPPTVRWDVSDTSVECWGECTAQLQVRCKRWCMLASACRTQLTHTYEACVTTCIWWTAWPRASVEVWIATRHSHKISRLTCCPSHSRSIQDNGAKKKAFICRRKNISLLFLRGKKRIVQMFIAFDRWRFSPKIIKTTPEIKLIPKTIGNRKRDCAWGCAGVKKLKKNQLLSTNHQNPYQLRLVMICAQQLIFLQFFNTRASSRTISFLFPIVFGINLIEFFDVSNRWPLREGRDGKCEGGNDKCDFLARESANLSPILARQWWRHFRLWWPLREGRDGECEGRNDKCEFLARESANLSPNLARQWWRHFRLTTSVSLLPSHYFCLSLSLSLSLSLTDCTSRTI